MGKKLFLRRQSVQALAYFVSLLVYKILLDYIYVGWLYRYYHYQSFEYSFSLKCFLLSAVVTVILSISIIIRLRRKSFSDITIALLEMLYFFPALTLFAFANNNLPNFVFFTSYLFIILLWNLIFRFPRFRLKLEKRMNMMVIWTIILCVLMVLISGIYTGFRVSFDLSEYYELRFEAREYTMPTVVSYLFNWARYIIPVGILYAAITKRYGLIVFSGVAQILAFSFNGKKSSLFLFFLAFIFAYFYKPNSIRKTPYVFAGIGFLGVLVPLIRFGESFINKYIIRRVMFVPPNLGYVYFDFFSKHELDYLRGSVLRRFGFKSPYADVSVSRLLGYLYTGSDANNLNTGLCGDAFCNFGWYSLLLYPLLIVLMLKLMERCIEGCDYRLNHFVAILTAYMLINGAYFKMLLTNGYLLLFFLMNSCSRERLYRERLGTHDHKTNSRKIRRKLDTISPF